MGTLTISGIGIKNAIPDIASIRASVQATKETTQEALTVANEGMASLIAKLDELGLDKKDRQTAHFSVRPKFKQDDDGRYQHDQITGWTVQNTLVVKIRNLSQLGVILTLAGEHGSVNGPSFSNSNESALLDEARQLAMKDAIRKAQLYAEAAGVSLGGIIEIAEQSHQQPYAVKAMRMSVLCEDVDSGPAPVEAGEQTLSMSIHAVFEMAGNVTTEAEEEDDEDSFID